MKTELQNRITQRRLLPQDLHSLQELYCNAARDGEWLLADTADKVLHSGQMWGCFAGRELQLCGGFCSLQSTLALPTALAGTGLVPKRGVLFLPVASVLRGQKHLPGFLDLLTAHCHLAAAGNSKALYAIVPVKTGSPCLESYFAAGFTLVAIRPLFELRPHYIFTATQVQTEANHSIMIPVSDSFNLSRALEIGYCGTGIIPCSGVPTISLQLREKDVCNETCNLG